MQKELEANYPDLEIQILGVNHLEWGSGNSYFTAGNDIPDEIDSRIAPAPVAFFTGRHIDSRLVYSRNIQGDENRTGAVGRQHQRQRAVANE